MKLRKIYDTFDKLAEAGYNGDLIRILSEIQLELDRETLATLLRHIKDTDIDEAEGAAADGLALRLAGIRRRPATRSIVRAGDKVVKFYSDTTFGDLNKVSGTPTDITIDEAILYDPASDTEFELLDTPVVLPANESERWVGVISKKIGTGKKIAAGRLNRHNFQSYEDAARNSLKCTNIYPILDGIPRESDGDLLQRAKAARARAVADNTLVVKELVMDVPDVSAVYVARNGYGGGSLVCYVSSIYGYPSSSLIRRVQDVLDSRIERDVYVLPMERIWVRVKVTALMEAPRGNTDDVVCTIRNEVLDILNTHALEEVSTKIIEELEIPGVMKLIVDDLVVTKETEGVAKHITYLSPMPYEIVLPSEEYEPVEVKVVWRSLQQ